jgi:FlaA1/EpsC-like NDP-sugar epimerase
MDSILSLVDRQEALFAADIQQHDEVLRALVSSSSFLVIGGAGTIGQAVVKEIFSRDPTVLHVVDISENNLVELVRDIRSSMGYIKGDFRSFALDVGSIEFDAMLQYEGPYDYVLNLSALKHVRSEKDPYTLMRMISVNIENTEKTLQQAIAMRSKKYFAVSTDKAANPVNMMGASKRIMEHFLMRGSQHISVSTARFANVAFSDGSLLHGFNQRIQKQQAIAAPSDVKRYFVTPKESGELCLTSCLLGENRQIFFPKLSETLHLVTFESIARAYLKQLGYQAVACENEEQARNTVQELSTQGQWPCYFSVSDTTGEKDFEEFFMEHEALDLERFTSIGIINQQIQYNSQQLDHFTESIQQLKTAGNWQKTDLVSLFQTFLPEFDHTEKQRFLDNKM